MCITIFNFFFSTKAPCNYKYMHNLYKLRLATLHKRQTNKYMYVWCMETYNIYMNNTTGISFAEKQFHFWQPFLHFFYAFFLCLLLLSHFLSVFRCSLLFFFRFRHKRRRKKWLKVYVCCMRIKRKTRAILAFFHVSGHVCIRRMWMWILLCMSLALKHICTGLCLLVVW